METAPFHQPEQARVLHLRYIVGRAEDLQAATGNIHEVRRPALQAIKNVGCLYDM